MRLRTRLTSWSVTTRRERTHEVFKLRTSFYAWGNEPAIATIYSGVALLLQVGGGVC